jgi:hypothetical protein
MGKIRIRGGRQGGQTLIIFAIAMPLFLSLVALVVDGSTLMVNRRTLQVAADAASLAAAQEITSDTCDPACIDGVEHKAGEYSDKNGGPSDTDGSGNPFLPRCTSPSKTNCVAVPYVDKSGVPHPTQVEVRLTKRSATYFARAIGLKNLFDVSARAVAGTGFSVAPDTYSTSIRTGTTDPGSTITNSSTVTTTITVAIPGEGSGVAFAKSTACPAIKYNGTAKGAHMGSFATNGGVRVGGNSDKTIDYLAVGRRGETVNGVPCFDNQAGATINQVVGPFAPIDWPLPLPPVPTPPSGCTSLGSANVNFTASPSRPPGVYCITGTTGVLTLNSDLTTQSGPTGTGYTFFAPCISVSGGKYKYYRPASGPAPSPPTLFYASAQDSTCPSGAALTIQGQGATIEGDMFAPDGEASLQGGGVSAGTGFIESQTLSITGNSANFQGNGPIISGTTTTTSTSTNYFTTTILGVTDPGTTVTSTIPGATTGTVFDLDE